MADGPPRVLFMGMLGAFSVPPVEALIAAGIPVCGMVLPRYSPAMRAEDGSGAAPSGQVGRSARMPREVAPGLAVLSERRTILDVAREQHLRVLEVTNLAADETLAIVRDLAPDVIAVACFDRLIPRSFRELARVAVNVHPSLLPDNRGPAPVLWTIRRGLTTTGVTIHLLEDRMDAGSILAQQSVPVPAGTQVAELEAHLARLGGDLLVRVIRDFQAGHMQPRPQDESQATRFPWPSPSDWPP